MNYKNLFFMTLIAGYNVTSMEIPKDLEPLFTELAEFETPITTSIFITNRTQQLNTENNKLIAKHIQHSSIDQCLYTCDWPSCDKEFKRPDNLARHKRIHTGEKPYMCDWPECHSSFREKGALNRHTKSHARLLLINKKIADESRMKFDNLIWHQENPQKNME